MPKRLFGWAGLFIIVSLYLTSEASIAHAEVLQSPNYKLNESTIGAGGLNQSSSTTYRGIDATTDIAVGNANSSNYQIEAGALTSDEPALSFNFSNALGDFGAFSPTGAVTATTTFSVSNYTSYGYAVQITGNPPSNGTHTISAMSSTGVSVPGTDQFGINLVANTSPTSFGSNPNNGQFGFGYIAPNYSTANHYRYVSGETIAQADKSSGMTTYTISYMINVSPLTPGGKYTSNQTLIITGTY